MLTWSRMRVPSAVTVRSLAAIKAALMADGLYTPPCPREEARAGHWANFRGVWGKFCRVVAVFALGLGHGVAAGMAGIRREIPNMNGA